MKEKGGRVKEIGRDNGEKLKELEREKQRNERDR